MKSLQNYAAYDIEARNWTDYVLGAIAYNSAAGLQTEFFKTAAELLDGFIKISESASVKLFYAHNGGKYDVNFLVNEILERDYLIDVIEISGRIIEMKVMFLDNEKKHRHLFSLRDSYALFPTSLEKIASELLNKNKLTDLVDYENIQDTAELRTYLEQDVIILYETLEVYFNFTGFVCITQPSAAMKIYSEKYEKHGIFNFNRKNDYINKVLKEFYFGGRVEIFQKTGNNLYYYDVNSLYPYVMRNNFYPYGEITEIYGGVYNPNKLGLYTVKINQLTNFKISPLAIRTETGIYYVNCNPDDVVNITTIELKYLIKHKIKFTVLSGYEFSHKAKIFTGYVDYFYKKRLESTNNKVLYKNFLNTLYGKFGMSKNRYIIRNYVKAEKKKELNQIRYINDYWIEQPCEIFSKKVLPEIAAFVTAYARSYMLSFYEKYFNYLVYTDTDSIIMSKPMDDEFINPTKLGAFKFEGFFESGIFLQSKTYALKNKDIEQVKFKGFNAKNFSYKDFEMYLENGNLLTENQFRLTSALRTEKFERIEVKKTVKTANIKRGKDKSLYINQVKRK